MDSTPAGFFHTFEPDTLLPTLKFSVPVLLHVTSQLKGRYYKMAQGKSVTIDTDWPHTSGVVHDFEALCKCRKFLKSQRGHNHKTQGMCGTLKKSSDDPSHIRSQQQFTRVDNAAVLHS